ncbi:MAG: alpha/beta fold hydrolase BchO [Pseudomonadota bacterium]
MIDWQRARTIWPHAAASRFIETRAQRWHVQIAGAGPAVLLLHGAGGANHSWRGLFETLSTAAQVISPDLPGHGLTRAYAPARSSLPTMAEDIAALLDQLGARPALIVGHSAGAALALRLVLDHPVPASVLALNPALRPFDGPAALMMPALARLTALNPFAPYALAQAAGSDRVVARMLEATGSAADAEMAALYRLCFSDPDHIAGTLRMMARWELSGLGRDLKRLTTPLTVALGANDRAVAPATTRRVLADLPGASLVSIAKLGHLMHEEAPARFAALALECLEAAHV